MALVATLGDIRPKKAELGLHLIGDLYDCKGEEQYFFSSELLRDLCLNAVREAGLTVVGDYFHDFGNCGGVTGVVVLAESHLAVHTWPEKRYVTLDVYVCNYTADNRAKAQRVFERLIEVFAPSELKQHAVDRE